MEFDKVIIYVFLVIVALSYLYATNHFDSDYFFHLAYNGDGAYPPFLSWLLSSSVMPVRGWELFILNLLFAVYLPFVLITEITHRWEPGVVYLLSGVPFLSFIIWTVPQSIVMVMMLLAIWNPGFIVLFLIGPWVHEFWYAALFLAIGYYIIKAKKEYIERIIKGLRLPYGTQ